MVKIAKSKNKTLREINNTLLDFKNLSQFAVSSTPIVDIRSKRKRKYNATEIDANTSIVELDKKENPRKEKPSHNTSLHRTTHVDVVEASMDSRSKRKRKHKETEIAAKSTEDKNNSRKEKSSSTSTLHSKTHEDTVENQIYIIDKSTPMRIDHKSTNALTHNDAVENNSLNASRLRMINKSRLINSKTNKQITSRIYTKKRYPKGKRRMQAQAALKEVKKLPDYATLINFICNPASQENELVIGYLKECLSCQNDGDINRLLTSNFHIQNVDKV